MVIGTPLGRLLLGVTRILGIYRTELESGNGFAVVRAHGGVASLSSKSPETVERE